jgi:hypothetical protein
MTKRGLSIKRNINMYYYREKHLIILKHCLGGGGQLTPDSRFYLVLECDPRKKRGLTVYLQYSNTK